MFWSAGISKWSQIHQLQRKLVFSQQPYCDKTLFISNYPKALRAMICFCCCSAYWNSPSEAVYQSSVPCGATNVCNQDTSRTTKAHCQRGVTYFTEAGSESIKCHRYFKDTPPEGWAPISQENNGGGLSSPLRTDPDCEQLVVIRSPDTWVSSVPLPRRTIMYVCVRVRSDSSNRGTCEMSWVAPQSKQAAEALTRAPSCRTLGMSHDTSHNNFHRPAGPKLPVTSTHQKIC